MSNIQFNHRGIGTIVGMKTLRSKESSPLNKQAAHAEERRSLGYFNNSILDQRTLGMNSTAILGKHPTDLATRHRNWLVAAAICLPLAGCGAGSAAVAGGGGGGGGLTGNAATVASGLRVNGDMDNGLRALVSPASIRFELTDDENDDASITLSFATPPPAGMDPQFAPITIPAGGGPADLDAVQTNQGTQTILWDFAADLGSGGFRDDVLLKLEVAGGISPPNLSNLEIGNDAPTLVTSVVPAAGVGGEDPSGNIEVRFQLSDSASDAVDIKVEFDIIGDNPDAGFQLARSATTPAADPTPEFALTDIQPTETASPITFRWDSAFAPNPSSPLAQAQLAGREEQVAFRFTARERRSDAGQPQAESSSTTPVFRVDNNAPPLAVLLEGSLLLGVKDRGNIPLRFQIFDAESDPVQVVVQWRSAGQQFDDPNDPASKLNFPPLPTDQGELLDILNNPARERDRRALQIAKEAPQTFGGRLARLPGLEATQARLPELAGSAIPLAALDLDGRRLDLLRPSLIPTLADLPESPLSNPTGVVVSSDGRSAFVLDSGDSGWDLIEIDLENGALLRSVAVGAGAPLALAKDALGERLFVASDASVFIVDILSASVSASIQHGFGSSLRAMVARGSDEVLATADTQLVSFNFATGNQGTLLSGLNQPFGLALDPGDLRQLYVAEQAADRILIFDLRDREQRTLAVQVAAEDLSALGNSPLPNPRHLSFTPDGKHLWVLCEDVNGPSLRSVHVGSTRDASTPADGFADSFAREITDQLGEAGGAIAFGPQNTSVVNLPGAGRLAIGGGILQSRRIIASTIEADPDFTSAVDLENQLVRLESAFDGIQPLGTAWRIQAPISVSGSPTGRSFTFVWDSSDVPDADRIQLRVTPRDQDAGVVTNANAFRSYRSDFPINPTSSGAGSGLQNPPGAQILRTSDLDSDGDLDIAVAYINGGSNFIQTFYQDAPGQFTNGLRLPGFDFGPLGIRDFDFGDLNNDGRIDLVSANASDSTLGIFFQDPSLKFEASEGFFFSATLQVFGPDSVEAADLNGDANLDLVTNGSQLTIFIQQFFGSFATSANPSLGNGGKVTTADLNNDGALDLIQAGTQGSNIGLFLQTSPGIFTPTPTLVPSANFPADVNVADLDADGDPDLISTGSFNSEIELFIRDESGTYAPSPADLSLDQLSSVATADLDNDGDTDIAATSLSDNITFFYQTNPGEFTEGTRKLATASGPASLAAVDIDGDGRVDLANVNSSVFSSPQFTVYLQDSPGRFAVGASEFSTSDILPIIKAADLNGDGVLDLACPRPTKGDLGVFFQTAPGVLAQAKSAFSAPSPTGVCTADLDADGDTDLVAGSDFQLTLGIQTSPGTFELGPALAIGAQAGHPECGDLDSDGDVDLLVPLSLGQELSLFTQTDVLEFNPNPTSIPTGNAPEEIEVVDIDLDGDLDLLVAHANAGNLSILIQNANGNLAPSALALSSGGRAVRAADLDADGDLDIATTSLDRFSIQTFMQVSTGSFMAGPAMGGSFFEIRQLNTIDFDRDGDIDLLATRTDGADALAFQQIAPGIFEASLFPNFDLQTAPQFLVPADMDLDGDLDLVAGSKNVFEPFAEIRLIFNGR